MFGYYLLLKTENWKYYSKIIFKRVNSAVRLNFKVIFAKKKVLAGCTRPIEKRGTQLKSVI